jgi:hypothetical protein
LKTAQDGEFLGKNWSSMWVPLRMVMGIAALFPTTSGYSALQVLMMWVIVQGVGAADTLWNTAVNYVALAGSPYATISLPSTGDVSQNIQRLYQALACEATALRTDKDTYPPDNKPYYYCADPQNQISGDTAFCSGGQLRVDISNTAACTEVPVSGGNPYVQCKIGPNGQCGTLTYSDSRAACQGANNGDVGSILQCAGSQAQQEALQKITDPNLGLEKLATQFAQLDHDYLAFYANTNPTPPPLWYAIYASNGSCSATAMPAVPDWVESYCSASANRIQPAACCVINKTTTTASVFTPSTACVPSTAPRVMESVRNAQLTASQCEATNLTTGPFYGGQDYVGSGASSLPDPTNANKDAVLKVYWSYGIKPLLTSTASANSTKATTATLQLTNDPNFIKASVDYYAAYLAAGLANAMMSQASKPVPVKGWQADAESMGWIMAGAYYYQIANQNDDNTAKAIPTFSVTVGDVGNTSNGMHAYRNNINAINNLIAGVQQEELPPGSFLASSPGLAQVGSQLNGMASSVVGNFMQALSGGTADPNHPATNPLVALQHLGRDLLITAQVMYAVFMTLAVITIAVGSINFIALGFGLTSNPAETGLQFLFQSFWIILLAFMAWCLTFGGMLAVYVPLIPYILFTMGAIGWLTATIEAMVAAPLVALGILSPGGQGEILSRGAPAVMILFNIFLRPSLMIFGMMASMLLAPVVVMMINAGFKGVMGSINGNPGLPELIFFISAYATLLITALNKCFSLIHVIPEQVMGWIEGGGGHKAGVGGAADAAGEMKGAVTGAASSTAGAADRGSKALDKQAGVKDAAAAATTAKNLAEDPGFIGPRKKDGTT